MPDTADPSVSEPALHDPLPDPNASLNPEQRAAVKHDVGSGKTNTLAHRVARLIQAGADPQRIFGTSAQAVAGLP